jgi:hypothetical protein
MVVIVDDFLAIVVGLTGAAAVLGAGNRGDDDWWRGRSGGGLLIASRLHNYQL